MKIGHKMTLGYVGLALFVFILGFLTSQHQQSLQQQIDVILTSNVGEIRASEEIAYHLQRVKSEMRGLILSKEYGYMELESETISRVENSLDEIAEHLHILEQSTEAASELHKQSNNAEDEEEEAEELAEIQQLKKDIAIFRNMIASLIRVIRHERGISAEEISKMLDSTQSHAYRIEERVEELESDAHKEIAQSLRQMDWDISSGITKVAAYTFTGFMLAILIGFYISRTITTNIRRVTEAAADIGAGNFDSTIHIDTHDEIADLAQDINRMAANLQQITVSRDELADEMDERLRTEKELIEAKQLAEQADQAKSKFLANMSHEIRTPLHGMLGIAEHLNESNLDSQQHENMNTLLQSGGILLSLINDILDFSKIESDQLELDNTVFKPGSIVKEVVDMLLIKAAEKSISLVYKLPETNRFHIQADQIRLRQILINLVGNAIKFTNSGGSVSISLDSELLNKDQLKLKYIINDNGIGIAQDQLHNIFEKFTQADISTARQYGGTGIGLSICRDLVHMMGGEIDVESQPGVGSTFTLQLLFPCIERELETTGTDSENSSNDMSCLTGARILAADDNPVNCKVLQLHLQKMGCQLDIAQHGQQAVEMVRNGDYQLVLMDMHMPVMDGLEATRAIRAAFSSSSHQIPIIAMTANVIKGTREKCLAAGMNDYLSKPAKPEQLKAMLIRYL